MAHLRLILLLSLAAFTHETFTYILAYDFNGSESLFRLTTLSPDSPTARSVVLPWNKPLLPDTSGIVKTHVCDPEGVYTKEDSSYCDRYVTCSYGRAYSFECSDGYGYVSRKGCKLLHEVQCGSRLKLQPPKGSGLCQRLNGIYRDPFGCDRYIRCNNGTASAEKCTGQSIFDDWTKSCRDPTLQEYSRCFLQQQTQSTITPPANQQTLSNYNSIDNQAAPPTTYRPSASVNEQPTTSYNPFANQQAPVTDYNLMPNQLAPMTYNPQTNQPIQTTYRPPTLSNQVTTPTHHPSVYDAQQMPSPDTDKPPASADIQNPIFNPTSVSYPVSQYGETITGPTYEIGETSVAAAGTGTNGFVCPPSTFYAFGDHTRYQYPGNCHLFYICLRDGGIKLGGCQAPMAYNPKTQVCNAMQYVPSCSANVR